MVLNAKKTPVANEPEPVWDLARLYPAQGAWSESDYLSLDTNRLVEFTDGHIEVLPMPTQTHQFIVRFLLGALYKFADPALGTVLFAGTLIRLRDGMFREPDIVFMRSEHADRRHEQYWEGADLVMEVVSQDRGRDLDQKRAEYAQAGIPEYWIVDGHDGLITVLTLRGARYQMHGAYRRGQRAESVLLPGFSVDVAAALDAR